MYALTQPAHNPRAGSRIAYRLAIVMDETAPGSGLYRAAVWDNTHVLWQSATLPCYTAADRLARIHLAALLDALAHPDD